MGRMTFGVWFGCLLLSGLAFAQPAQQAPSLQKRPQGFNPATPAAAQTARPPGPGLKAEPEPPMTEWIAVRNPGATSAWITLSRYGMVEIQRCLQPKGERQWLLYDARKPFQIRAEVTEGDQCERPVRCDTTFQSPQGVKALELRGCNWAVVAPEPRLKAAPTCCFVRNPTKYSIWLTMYWQPVRKIYATACVPPGGHTFIDAPNFSWLRAELTLSANCQKPVGCDTTIDTGTGFSGNRGGSDLALLPANWAPRGGCWWQWTK